MSYIMLIFNVNLNNNFLLFRLGQALIKGHIQPVVIYDFSGRMPILHRRYGFLGKRVQRLMGIQGLAGMTARTKQQPHSSAA
jgi:hypothetical protein